MLFWSTTSDSFNPHCRLCLQLGHRVWICVSCWVIWNSVFMFACMCLRGFMYVCVCACVSFFSQNLPYGRARPWASVRRVCARLSPLCPLKLCRLKLLSFSRSVCPALNPFSSSFHPFLWVPLSFSVWFSLWGSVQGIIHPTPVCPNHSPPIIPSYSWCAPWPSSSPPSQPLNQIKGSRTRAPAH